MLILFLVLRSSNKMSSPAPLIFSSISLNSLRSDEFGWDDSLSRHDSFSITVNTPPFVAVFAIIGAVIVVFVVFGVPPPLSPPLLSVFAVSNPPPPPALKEIFTRHCQLSHKGSFRVRNFLRIRRPFHFMILLHIVDHVGIALNKC